jgi:bifunctional Delta-12/omega-3 fatty acid desaturase
MEVTKPISSLDAMEVDNYMSHDAEGSKVDIISLKTIKKAVPASCFESSLVHSLLYTFRDIVYATTLVYLAFQIQYVPYQLVRWGLWAVYGFLQGCVGTGIWILAHECGHGSFSSYPLVNDIVGWLLHSSLLVPYFSWKITHARHHRYTGHMEKDTAFVPATGPKPSSEGRFHAIAELMEDTPINTALGLLRHQIVGWQAYLLLYVTAGQKSQPARDRRVATSHFNPLGELWTSSQRSLILISDIGLLAIVGLLYLAGLKVGFGHMVALYFVPYFWVHHWIGKNSLFI